jgi:hypothetical protein
MIRVSSSRFAGEAEMMDALDRAGVEVDRGFPPVRLDKEGSTVLVRGHANPDDVERIGEQLGVEFFPELGISTT